MDLGDGFTETVQFELPDLAGAVRLATRLRTCWAVFVSDADGVAIVDAMPGTSPADLASLMRTVESWVEEEALCAIRFELDGRVYVLEAGNADWSAVPRPVVTEPA
ncbi:MAG TPA: hypothetical protein VH420_08460 [Gaiellaceae bacterium]|jgi:hypothetical protein